MFVTRQTEPRLPLGLPIMVRGQFLPTLPHLGRLILGRFVLHFFSFVVVTFEL